MPQQNGAKKRRRTFFARIPSTFTNKLSSVCSITDDKKMLHSKSTYFYRWGSGKKLSSKMTFLIPSVCGLALLVGAFVAVNPTVNDEKVYAYTVTSGGTTGGTGSGETTEDAAPSIAISFPTEGLPEGFNNNAEQVTTAKAGEVAYRSNIFDVTVNNSNWYAILVRAANGYTSELKNGNAKIIGVGKNVPAQNFKENTWGYALTTDIGMENGALSYSSLPESDNLIPSFSSAASSTTEQRFKIVFATLFAGDSPSGHYATKVYLSAVTNPAQVVTMTDFGVATMQELGSDPTICANAPEGTTGQLMDVRDNKLYWVTKLKDGNCWMTQNLDFDIPDILYGDTSGINTASVVTDVTRVENTSDWLSSSSHNVYYDPGDYTYDGPNNTHAKGTACNTTTLESCSQFSKVNQTSDLHYHVGNYYSWLAATVKTGDITGGEATSSVCPAGWLLPTTGSSSNGGTDYRGRNGSIPYMLSKYGLSSNDNSSISGYVDGTSCYIYGEPLYFVYGGYLPSDNLYAAGSEGRYRSSVKQWIPGKGTYLPILHFSDKLTSSSTTGSQEDGLSVRCLVLTGGNT